MGISNTFQSLSAGNWCRNSLERWVGCQETTEKSVAPQNCYGNLEGEEKSHRDGFPERNWILWLRDTAYSKWPCPEGAREINTLSPLFPAHLLPRLPIGWTHMSTREWERTWYVHLRQPSGKKQEEEQKIDLEDHLSEEDFPILERYIWSWELSDLSSGI